MSGDEPARLASARVVRGNGDSRLLRGLTVAVAIGAVATVALRSSLAAVIVAGFAVVVGGLRLFHAVLERDAEKDQPQELALPQGDRPYSYRPRALSAVILVAALAACALTIAAPDLAWISLLAVLVAGVSLPLSEIEVRVWGAPGSPSFEISSFREVRDFTMAFLGEANFHELVRVLEQRSGAERATSSGSSTSSKVTPKR